MKRIIILMLIFLLFGSFGYAEIINIITQQQLDNYNVNSISFQSLNCAIERPDFCPYDICKHKETLYTFYRCNDISREDQPDGSYTYIIHNDTLSHTELSANYYLNLRDLYGNQIALNRYRAEARNQGRITLDNIRKKVTDWQTPEDPFWIGWNISLFQ